MDGKNKDELEITIEELKSLKEKLRSLKEKTFGQDQNQSDDTDSDEKISDNLVVSAPEPEEVYVIPVFGRPVMPSQIDRKSTRLKNSNRIR